MTGSLARAASAELVKLLGLPVVRTAVAGTVVAAAVLAAAAAVAPAYPSDPTTPTAVLAVVRTIPLLQVGPALVGVLAVATEYEGRQILTTLSATPARTRLLAGKTVAAALTLVATGIASCGAGLAAASITVAGRTHRPATAPHGHDLAGAVAYLVLIGLLGLAVTVALRTLVASLVTVLSYLLVVSPLAAGWTEQARWLPDRVGRLLLGADADPVLDPGTGGPVLLAWITVSGTVIAVVFARRDA